MENIEAEILRGFNSGPFNTALSLYTRGWVDGVTHYRASSSGAQPPQADNTAIAFLKEFTSRYHRGEEYDQPAHYSDLVSRIDKFLVTQKHNI